MIAIHADRLTATGTPIPDDRVCGDCGLIQEWCGCDQFRCQVCTDYRDKAVWRRFAVEED
jgi:hypothetical protein